MALADFLLKVVTDDRYINAFGKTDNAEEQQALINEHNLTREEQELLSSRDLSGLRVKVHAEFDLEDDEIAAVTIHGATGTIYIPPPPPPQESSTPPPEAS